jgi:acetyltransferase-like isoleucine patch superfamily enzyme
MPITCGDHSTIDQDYEIYSNFVDPNIKVGKYTQIGPGVIYCGSINHPWIKNRKSVSSFSFTTQWHIDYLEPVVTRGDIEIGNDVWIGRNARILDGVKIGDGAIVGAFAVIAKDIPSYSIVVGNPAEIKHYRFNEDQIKKLLEIRWWNWSDDVVRERLEDMKDVDIFLKKYYKEGD